MINLIKNEFTKVFKKKSLFIMLSVMVGAVLLYNIIVNSSEVYVSSGYSYDMEYLNDNRAALERLDPNNPNDNSSYIYYKTEVDLYELAEEYKNTMWQEQKVHELGYSIISNLNTAKYSLYENVDESKAQKEYDEFITKLKDGDWRYFSEKKIRNHEETLKSIKDEKGRQDEKRNIELEIEVEKLRLENDIEYGNDYLNIALDEYFWSRSNLLSSENDPDLDHSEKVSIQQQQENSAINKYIIENKEDLNKASSKQMLTDLLPNFLWIICFIVIVVAGSIVSDEHSKGTIKLLLVKPYKRITILTAKFISCLIMILIAFLAITLVQLVIGGIIFGFDSLGTPAVIYNFTESSVMAVSVPMYIIYQFIAYLPQIILLLTLAFTLSTLFNSSALAISIPLIGIFASTLINEISYGTNKMFMRYFVTLNWDFNIYAFGKLPRYEYVNFIFSVIICIIYFLIMMIPTYIVFKRKNIKNI